MRDQVGVKVRRTSFINRKFKFIPQQTYETCSYSCYTMLYYCDSLLGWAGFRKKTNNSKWMNQIPVSRGQKTNLKVLEELTSQNIRALMHVCSVAKFCQLFETLWTVDRQASPSMGFPRQEYQSGLPFSSPEYKGKNWERGCRNRMRHENYFHGMFFDVKLLSHTKGIVTYTAQET